MKVEYTSGTWFAVPLRDDGFAVGLVARATPEGPAILAYFFGPRLESIPSLVEVSELKATSAVKIARVSDLHLIDGRWPTIGQSVGFRKNEWPFPKFVRSDEITRRAWVVEYADDDPGRVVTEVPVAFGASTLDRDAAFGAGAIELALTKLLGEQ